METGVDLVECWKSKQTFWLYQSLAEIQLKMFLHISQWQLQEWGLPGHAVPPIGFVSFITEHCMLS
jgi:hypothetical protein